MQAPIPDNSPFPLDRRSADSSQGAQLRAALSAYLEGKNVPSIEDFFDQYQKFSQLSASTRVFLGSLTPEDVKSLNSLLRAMSRGKVLAWFLKWTVVSSIGILTAVVMLGEKLEATWSMFGRWWGK